MSAQSVPEITPLELVREVEAGGGMQIVDVRLPSRVAGGRIDIIPDDAFHNVVGSHLMASSTVQGTGIDPALPVTVVCGHGNDSRVVAGHLIRLGCDARSLAGGMAAWMVLSVPRLLRAPDSLDRLVQFDRMGKGSLAYILISSGEAMIIDPSRHVEPYLRLLEETGATLVAVADTHVHADYISGASSIARTFGVPYYLHSADTVYPYDNRPGRLDIRPVHDGMSIPVGRSPLDVLHTPGHTTGSVTYCVGRQAAFTGDFLFLRSIGRPDLAGKTEEWSALLWASIEAVKHRWPPDIMIYPAHYSSPDERGRDGTIGAPFAGILPQCEPLGFAHQGEFMDWVRNKSATFPDAYRTIKGINTGLISVSEQEADELEIGKNECALGGR